jgi:hypothetical protein
MLMVFMALSILACRGPITKDHHIVAAIPSNISLGATLLAEATGEELVGRGDGLLCAATGAVELLMDGRAFFDMQVKRGCSAFIQRIQLHDLSSGVKRKKDNENRRAKRYCHEEI